MVRTLIIIPRMYSMEEIKKLTGIVPEDFEDASKEFWIYIEEKLTPFYNKVKKVYCQETVKEVKETIEKLERSREFTIIKKLADNNAEITTVEEQLLLAESKAWLEMLKKTDDQSVLELYNENIRDRDEHIVKILNQTLNDEEFGVLLFNMDHKLLLPEDIRVIKMCRFDPEDYLNRWLVTLELKRKSPRV